MDKVSTILVYALQFYLAKLSSHPYLNPPFWSKTTLPSTDLISSILMIKNRCSLDNKNNISSLTHQGRIQFAHV